jgi:hypothetical protein
MTLREKQSAFALMVGKLIVFAYEKGYELTLGDAFAIAGHKPNSNHYIRLAIDLNLFKDGIWLNQGMEMERGHGILHDYWDSLGGAKRIDNDLNHYALEHLGRR